jgi:hypothetical protein
MDSSALTTSTRMVLIVTPIMKGERKASDGTAGQTPHTAALAHGDCGNSARCP